MSGQIYVVEVPGAGGKRHAFSSVDEAASFCEAQAGGCSVTLAKAGGSLLKLLKRGRKSPARQAEALVALRRDSVAGVVRQVVQDPARLTGLTQGSIRGGSRCQPIARVRKLGYWVTAHRCDRAWSDLGRAWGKDHSTLMHGVRSFQADLDRGTPWAVKLRESWEWAAGGQEAVAS